jgi:hypothetical protein
LLARWFASIRGACSYSTTHATVGNCTVKWPDFVRLSDVLEEWKKYQILEAINAGIVICCSGWLAGAAAFSFGYGDSRVARSGSVGSRLPYQSASIGDNQEPGTMDWPNNL